MEPIKLRIKNFYAITEGEIDFGHFSSALILGTYADNPLKSNGSGKSSIFDCISWVLFNKTRQAKMDDVIRWSAEEACVEFEFMFDNALYKIIRRRSRVAEESAVSFFTSIENKWINDSASTNSETNKKILGLLKIDANIFLNSVYFKQHDISLFATSLPSERKDIIKTIMKLERWDKYQKQAKYRTKAVEDNISLQQRIVNESSNLPVEIKNNNHSIELIQKTLNELTLKYETAQSKLHILLEIKKESNLDILLNRLNTANDKILGYKTQGKTIKTNLLKLQSTEQQNKTEYEKCLIAEERLNTEQSKYKNNIQKISNNLNYEGLENTILEKRTERHQFETILKQLNETAEQVGVGSCQVCFTPITDETLPHIHKSREELEKATCENLKNTIVELTQVENIYKERKENKVQLDNLTKLMDKTKNDLILISHKKNELELQVNDLQNNIKQAEIRITELIENIKAEQVVVEDMEIKIKKQKTSNTDSEIELIEAQNQQLNKTIATKNMELGALLKEQEFLAKKRDSFIEAGKKVHELNREKLHYDQLVRFFGKDGIQAVFMEGVVNELEHHANNTLVHICNEPTTIRLRTQKRVDDTWKETLEIDVIMNGVPQSFESLSGGERFRVSLALRIGLSEVLVKRAGGEIKLLLLDEIDSPLDTYGLNNLFENIIKGLEKRFKIIAISHNDRIKERFNDIIMVSKTPEGSFITQL